VAQASVTSPVLKLINGHLKEIIKRSTIPDAERAMIYGYRVRASLFFFAALVVPACGADSPSTPTPTYYQSTHTLGSPGFGGSPSTCHNFDNAKAGAVSVQVTPPSIHLVLRAGTCSAPGEILAANDTALTNVNAPAGSNHVRLSNPNPSGPETPYTLGLTYWSLPQ
jgi:hypothetical protein